jgi:hypothetical protein
MADDIKKKINPEWITQAMSGMKLNDDEQQISEEDLNKEVVLLVQGTNLFGDPIYSYVKVALRNYTKLRKAMLAGDNFTPSDFGEVVAAGRGHPTPEIKDEMRVQFGMVDITQKVKDESINNARAREQMNRPQPNFFGVDGE